MTRQRKLTNRHRRENELRGKYDRLMGKLYHITISNSTVYKLMILLVFNCVNNFNQYLTKHLLKHQVIKMRHYVKERQNTYVLDLL